MKIGGGLLVLPGSSLFIVFAGVTLHYTGSFWPVILGAGIILFSFYAYDKRDAAQALEKRAARQEEEIRELLKNKERELQATNRELCEAKIQARRELEEVKHQHQNSTH